MFRGQLTYVSWAKDQRFAGDRVDPVTLDRLQCVRVLHGEVADLDHLGHQNHGGDCLDSLDPLFLLRARSWLLGF